MIKLYDKLFPKKANDDDERFYQQCLRLSWIEPKHLKQENLFIDNFLPITNDYFEQINNEKSAVGKLEILSKIFDAINNVIIFNKGGKREKRKRTDYSSGLVGAREIHSGSCCLYCESVWK